MDLSSLADFHRVVVAGSLSKASRDSDRPKATLSRHIRQLEESLGVRLMERGTRSLRLTAEGQALYERTHDRLRDIEDVGRSIASGTNEPRGLLRVSMPVQFLEQHGGRLAAEFLARHPAVRLHMSASNRPVDLVEEGFDVVVRVNPDPTSELVGRCFARDEHWIVAPPTWSLPDETAETRPATVPAIGMTQPVNLPSWHFRHGNRDCHVLPDYRMNLTSLAAMRTACIAHAGATLLPRSMVHRDVAEGRLTHWGTVPDRIAELWVLHSSRRLVSPKVSAFVAFITESFPSRQL